MVQNDCMVTKKSYITIILTAHDDVDGEPKVEVKLQKSKPCPSQSIPLATSFKELQKQ